MLDSWRTALRALGKSLTNEYTNYYCQCGQHNAEQVDLSNSQERRLTSRCGDEVEETDDEKPAHEPQAERGKDKTPTRYEGTDRGCEEAQNNRLQKGIKGEVGQGYQLTSYETEYSRRGEARKDSLRVHCELSCAMTLELSGGEAVRLERAVRHRPRQPTCLLELAQTAPRCPDIQSPALTNHVHHKTRALAANATGATCGGKTDRRILSRHCAMPLQCGWCEVPVHRSDHT